MPGKLQTRHGAGRLVLITCDDWDGKVWRSNVVIDRRIRLNRRNLAASPLFRSRHLLSSSTAHLGFPRVR